MSGKRQHYIPRFLQRGFLHSDQEKAERVWLHRPGSPSRLVSTRDVAVGEYFYSKLSADGSATLDDIITSMEGGLDIELQAIRRTTPGSGTSSKGAGRLVSHLMLRNAHIRQVFTTSARAILGQLSSSLADHELARSYLEIDKTGLSGTFGSALNEALAKFPLEQLAIPRPFAHRYAAYMAREHYESLHGKHMPYITAAINGIADQISALVRDSHNKALSSNRSNELEKYLQTFDWHVRPIVGAILPDCIVIARERGGDFVPLLLADRNMVDLVTMAVAHDRLLVGTQHFSDLYEQSAYNQIAARCSDSFYISRSQSDGDDMADLVGTRSAAVIANGIKGAIDSTVEPSQKNKRGPIFVLPVTSRSPAGGQFQYSLACVGFGDEKLLADLNEVVMAIVREVNRELPTTTLDGITFSSTYTETKKFMLSELGHESPLAGERERYGRGVAKIIALPGDGISKSHIVLDSVLAQHLLAGDEVA